MFGFIALEPSAMFSTARLPAYSTAADGVSTSERLCRVESNPEGFELLEQATSNGSQPGISNSCLILAHQGRQAQCAK